MSTQKAYASYQEIIDLHTESDKVSVIGIHTPTGETPRRMFGGFFDQFKKFRYLGCSISFVPAARLPADPLQVSYEAGEPTIDPRDMLNPIMFHGCHGEDLGAILNKMYAIGSTGSIPTGSQFDIFDADSVFMLEENGVFGNQFDQIMLESLYYRALTDNTWKKAHPQRGFRKSGLRPLIYSLATTHQIAPGEEKTNLGPFGMDDVGFSESGQLMNSGVPTAASAVRVQQSNYLTTGTKKNVPQLMTPRLTSLGWLDTYNVLSTSVPRQPLDVSTIQDDLLSQVQQTVNPATLPCIFMGVILLPPAYKTEQYFRMIVTHHFAFRQFRGISYNPEYEVPSYFDWNNPDSRQEGASGEVVQDGTIVAFEGWSSDLEMFNNNNRWSVQGIEKTFNIAYTSSVRIRNNGPSEFSLDENNVLKIRIPIIYSAVASYLYWDAANERFTLPNATVIDSTVINWNTIFGEFAGFPGLCLTSDDDSLPFFASQKVYNGSEFNVWTE